MKKLLYALLVLCCLSINAFAQPGANDPTFNTFDIGFGYGDGANGVVRTTAVQPDGKIIIGGDFSSINGMGSNRIARLNSDGSLDLSFNPGTGANGTISATAVQSDGKIIIGGSFTTFNGTPSNRIARLNTDGSLDISFNPGTGANATVNNTAIQSDGKIIIGGSFTSFDGTIARRIARLNSDGVLDASFNPGTGPNDQVLASTIQPDGKIIIGGSFTAFNGTSLSHITRLNSDGSLDLSFNLGTGSNGWVYSVGVRSDGKILIGGAFTIFNGTPINRIARLNADGSLDMSFNPGAGANSSVRTTAIQTDGKIIIGGEFTDFNGTPINRIARLNLDGSIDMSFNPGTGPNSSVETSAIQSDGKITIGGNFTFFNDTGRNHVARLNADGSYDMSFNPGTGANSLVGTTAIQSDGKIIIGGLFTVFNGTPINRIARLNPDGSIDVSFNPGTGANGWVQTAAIQPDEKIIIGGEFTDFNGSVRNRIARLNADGSLDLSFDPGTGANNRVRTAVIQSDGKIIIGGDFTYVNGNSRNRIARLNADGSLDMSFNPDYGANNTVFSTAIQPDGKIIIGGFFNSYNGSVTNYIARLNADGSLDMSFNPGTGANNLVRTTTIQPDGKIIIGGALILLMVLGAIVSPD